jgi:cell division septation protein DedD
VADGPARAVPPAPRTAVKVAVSPSVAAALAAVAEARQATGIESPAQAGASFARHASPAPQVAASAPAPAAKPRPAAPAPAPKPHPAQVAMASGPWRVQLGAFSVRGNVDRLWSQLSGRSELSGKAKVTVPAGKVTKLQAGGFATRAAAEDACRSLRHSGHECLVTR